MKQKHNLTHTSEHDTRLPNAHPPPHDSWNSEAREWMRTETEHRPVAVCDDVDHEVVRIASTIEIRDLRSDEVEEYTLVAPTEANILENRISSLTPMGRALYGRRVGEVVEFEAPAGTVRVRVEKVRCPCWASGAERECAASR